MPFTALDIAKLNATDEMSGLIETNKNVAPELSLLPSFTIPGLTYKTAKRTSLPEGDFKPLGGGVTPGGSTYENVVVECANFANPLREMKDVIRTHRKGEAYALALAASAAVKGSMLKIGRTIYYGAGAKGANNVAAMPGLIDLYDSTNKAVDAGGTTANTGSSVWFLKFGNMEDGLLSLIFGNNQAMSLREWILQQIIVDATKNTVADAFTNELGVFPGLQLVDLDAAVRIKKLTGDAGKGLTDSLGYLALEKFPSGMQPDVALMTKRSMRQLRDSRTNNNGGNSQAPWPTDIAGIPIVATDSISNTEPLTL